MEYNSDYFVEAQRLLAEADRRAWGDPQKLESCAAAQVYATLALVVAQQHRVEATQNTERIPVVGDRVIYYNTHGFPRAAVVTGTAKSLRGEKHVTLISGRTPLVVHLHVWSPLPREYDVQSVPPLPAGDGPAENCWFWEGEK